MYYWDTTLAVTDKRLRDAVNQLESHDKKQTYTKQGYSSEAECKPVKKRLNLDDILGKRKSELIPNPDAPPWLKKLDEIAKEGKSYTIKRDGSLEEVS